MKKTFFICLLSIFLFTNCHKDKFVSYSFFIKNSTTETITLKFMNSVNSPTQETDVMLLPNDEKKVKIAERDYPAIDLFTIHPTEGFDFLIFETYVNGEKLDKELWHSENWTYYKIADLEAEYKMTITKEMLEE